MSELKSRIEASANVSRRDAFVGKEQQAILEKRGLWDRCSKVTHKPAKSDPLNLQASTIRTTEITGGATGTYTVEALQDSFPVVSFQWIYKVRGKNEVWEIQATCVGDDGSLFSGVLIYDADGTRRDCLSDDEMFVRAFTWLFNDEQAVKPDWLGEFSFTAGQSNWLLLTKDTCPACDTPFCNC